MPQAAQLTADDLIAMPLADGAKHYEVTDGELIVVGNAGAWHELIKSKIVKLLVLYAARTGFGEVFSETQFTLGPGRVRIPDAAWVSPENFSRIPRSNRAIAIAPDLAVEIVSQSEAPNHTERRLRDYLDAGCEVWQIFPSMASVTVWNGTHGVRLQAGGTLTSESLPGFSAPVDQIFDF